MFQENKNKVILVYPKLASLVIRRPPLTVLCLASYLEKAGFLPIVIDVDFESNWRKKILEEGGEAICIGISSLTGYQIHNALEVTNFVKKNFPQLPVVWGGVHPSLFLQQTLREKNIDIVVRGEGEASLSELVRALRDGKPLNQVLGISFKENGRVVDNPERPFLEMEGLPGPAWHLIDFGNYYSSGLSKKNIALQTSRGCPYHCTFCYNAEFNKSRWRQVSPQKVLEMAKEVTEKHGIDGIIFLDDNFFVDSERVKEICRLFIDNNLNIKWEADCRIDYLVGMDDQFLRLLKRAGLAALFLGAESGSQRMLDEIKKGITVEQILKSAELIKKYDFRGWYSFMMGFPGEKPEDVLKTIKTMKELRKITLNANTAIKIFMPYPGTAIFKTSKDCGFAPPENLIDWANFNSEEVNTPWPKHKFAAHFSLCSRFATEYDRLAGFFKNPLFKIVGYLIHKLEKFRWDHEFWVFPLELIIIKKVIRKL